MLEWPWVAQDEASRWVTLENERQREGTLQPASRQIICQPPTGPQTQGTCGIHTCCVEYIHSPLTSCRLLQHSWVPEREVAGGGRAHLPSLLLLLLSFIHHTLHTTFFFPSVASCLLFNCFYNRFQCVILYFSGGDCNFFFLLMFIFFCICLCIICLFLGKEGLKKENKTFSDEWSLENTHTHTHRSVIWVQAGTLLIALVPWSAAAKTWNKTCHEWPLLTKPK